jgi:beta-galactosidase GanA
VAQEAKECGQCHQRADQGEDCHRFSNILAGSGPRNNTTARWGAELPQRDAEINHVWTWFADDTVACCMRNPGFLRPLIMASVVLMPLVALCQITAPVNEIPHLARDGKATALMVDGKPFLMLAGELHNSSSSSLAYMEPEWPKLAAEGLNTVLMPVSWELVESQEGQYSFELVDGLLSQARAQHLHLVILWLAAWKNGMSGYAPAWVKADTKRFPRAVENDNPINVLSTFAPATLDADAKAFAALLAHLRGVDTQHTVVMVQVENEVGVLGASRDHSPEAERSFSGKVPTQLTQYLVVNHSRLNSELRELWEANGAKTAGTWTEIFGDSARTDEIFMAWHYAEYVQAVAARGKTAYPLPMYANAWLGGGDTPPGDYPSGGPQPRVLDVWKAAGNSLDMLCPDLYASGFADWASRYHRPDNPLFIPETSGGNTGSANVFYAVGEQNVLGFSPFGIDAGMHGEANPRLAGRMQGSEDLASSYHLIASMLPQIQAAQQSGDIHGFVLDTSHPSVDFVMHGLTVHVSLDQLFGYHAESGYGLVLQQGPDTFLGAGKGFRVSFTPRSAKEPQAGIASIEEGTYQQGTWVPGRRLNGDEADQGNNWRFDTFGLKIEKAVIYHAQ